MRVLINNTIIINDPSRTIKQYCADELTLDNPEYAAKQRRGLWLGNTPKTLRLFNVVNPFTYELPVGCLSDVLRLSEGEKSLKVEDVRREVPCGEYTTSIQLRDYQQYAVDAIVEHKTGVIEMFAGSGKTQVGLFAAYITGQKTLWMTHTIDLLEQAKERATQYSPDVKVSTITDGKCDLSGDIVFATVQTLHNMLDPSRVNKYEFGMIIVDECHRISINAESMTMFKRCCDYFSAPYKIGLTATLHRADTLTRGITATIGDPIFQIQRDTKRDEFVVISGGKDVHHMPIGDFQVPVHIYRIHTGYNVKDKPEVYDLDGVIDYTKLISTMAQDPYRNHGIIQLLNEIPKEAYTLVLSLRLSQMQTLYDGVNVEEKVMLTGSTKKSPRKQYLDMMRSGQAHMMFATYNLAKEGLDIPRLQYLVLAMPCKDYAVVVQSLGRVQRIFEGKDIGYVYDLVDDVGILKGFAQRRKSIYKKSGYFIQEI